MIGGMEITSAEEVHILALFENTDRLFAMQQIIYDHLPGLNDDTRYGDQIIANEDDEVLGFNERLLIGATEIPISEIVNTIHDLDGLAIAAHIDREGFGILGQLGFIPPGLALDAVEVSCRGNVADFLDLDFPIMTSSDAHKLDDVGRCSTRFLIETVTLMEFQKAFRGEDGRKVVID